LPQLRGERQTKLRCFGPSCHAQAAAPIWAHASTRSKAVCSFNDVMQFRRRIQANPLYPPSVQVECPRAECLGLGYLGSDTVMCFMCEHQWPGCLGNAICSDAPSEVHLEPGEIMKQCPSCQEHIIKNGGCDHMTCGRCRHQFWWSTLEPYHRP
jgi:hypothetical protein